jgi:hypothetical protein
LQFERACQSKQIESTTLAPRYSECASDPNHEKKARSIEDRAKSTPKEEGGGDKTLNVTALSNIAKNQQAITFEQFQYGKNICAMQEFFCAAHIYFSIAP